MLNIPGYTVEETLNENRHTTVYRGYRQHDDTPVILKVLRSEYPSSQEIAHFKREYEVTRMLRGDGVIQVYSLEEIGRSLFMVFEDFGGRSLAQILLFRKFNLTEFLQLALRITEIVGQIHQQHIIHKDINPSNILWNPATHQLKIIDFGISTVLSQEHSSVVKPDLLEGTFAYMSPEQTGRINRAVDYRSDFYSLGVTFYEILLGFLPFQTTDTMEMVHCHVARSPKPIHELNRNIPRAVSEIVMKLMAKNVEDRYQSISGVRADLQKCYEQLQFTGDIQYIDVGQHDISEKFYIPHTLYGRRHPLDTLHQAFERICRGQSELVMVSGTAGIGKSALVHAMHKPVVEQQGYFISSKFNQYQQHTPYSPLIQAFRTLVQHILTESEAHLATWKDKLRAALGANGQILIDLIPELEHLIGKQAPVPKLFPLESQNRFYLTLQNFIRVFTSPVHPLVIFLDDLQWTDVTSLKLLKSLMTTPDSQHLLLIGAYRDDGVEAEHPLLALLKELEEAGAIVRHIALGPLTPTDLSFLLADALHYPRKQVIPLGKVIFNKTRGNPLFVREFLTSLHEKKLLIFDIQLGCWTWNLEHIQGMAITDNVVPFMAARIRKLASHLQHSLQCAACIGNRFDLHTLAQTQGKTESEVADELDEAIQEGLILPVNETYSYVNYLSQADLEKFAIHVTYDFAHNGVREAVDALLSEGQRSEFHLKIGQHLLSCQQHADKRTDMLPDAVNHLNMGAARLVTLAERKDAASLNLNAAQQAKSSGAYRPALYYVKTGIRLLEEEGWQAERALMFTLHQERAELEYLDGNFKESERVIYDTLTYVSEVMEEAELYNLLIIQYTLKARYEEALQIGRTALHRLGITLPASEWTAALKTELAQVRQKLANADLTAIYQQTSMVSGEKRLVVKLLDALIPTAFQIHRELYQLLIVKIVNLSLTYGHAPEAAFSYAQYGALLGSVWGDYRQGYEFGMLAVKLSEKFHTPHQKCKALFSLAGELNSWVRHIKYTHQFEHEAYHTALRVGDAQIAGMTLMHRVMNMFYEGAALEQLLASIPAFLRVSQRTQNQVVTDTITGCYLIIQNLCGLTSGKFSFDIFNLTEAQYVQDCQERHSLMALCIYRILKLQVLYLYNRPDDALEYALKAESLLDFVFSFFARAEHTFYYSLCLTALFDNASETTRDIYWQQLEYNQEQLQGWAESCPENFNHKYIVIEAEKSRIQGNHFQAMQLYKQAAELAKTYEFLHQEALIYELTARFYMQHGFQEFAFMHVQEAHYAYTRWGAAQKVADLRERYPQVLRRISDSTPSQPLARDACADTTLAQDEKGMSILDLNTVVKSSQAISSEIVLAELLKQVMTITMENAGAQKGWLFLEKDGKWSIEAEATDDTEIDVLQAQPLETAGTMHISPVPTTIIQYVIRTGDAVLLNDATREGRFTHEPHIVAHQIKSVLCIPLFTHGKLNGVLYLENNLTTGAFTPDRLKVLNLLSSQMMISIENATLYKHLKESLAHQTELLNKQEELTRAYSRFVPSEFLSLLGKKSIVDVQLGEQIEQEITVMFCDIRGFTPLSEQMTPQENFNFINSYLGKMGPIIRDYHGFIDKYIGDAIMALFPTNADDAVQASIAMLRRLVEYNRGRKRAGYPLIEIGVGLNSGMLMLGTVGEQHRMDGTVISDAVNLASRIERMTKTYGVSLLISETTYFQLENASDYCIRIIDQVQAKGKSEPVTVFEVFDGDPPRIIELKHQTLSLFQQGFKLYHRTKLAGARFLFNDVLQVDSDEQMQQITQAQGYFSEILHLNPDDKVAQIYLQRCENIRKYGVSSEEWAQIWTWVKRDNGQTQI